LHLLEPIAIFDCEDSWKGYEVLRSPLLLLPEGQTKPQALGFGCSFLLQNPPPSALRSGVVARSPYWSCTDQGVYAEEVQALEKPRLQDQEFLLQFPAVMVTLGAMPGTHGYLVCGPKGMRCFIGSLLVKPTESHPLSLFALASLVPATEDSRNWQAHTRRPVS
jgi:hypothetical protein